MADVNVKAVISAEDKASAVLKRFGGAVSKVGQVAKIAAVAGVGALVGGLVASVKAASDSGDAMAQLNAVIRSTKGAAGVSAKAAADLATSLQGVTKFSDETILAGESMLLTFTKIGKDVFPTATETMLDMSQALGQDVKASAIQLGKALNDPIRGVTALRRVGVTFNDEQQKTIKKLVDAGKVMEAQKLILKELQVEFGGSAKAAGITFAGQLTILRNSLDDVMETIGTVIISAITPFINKAAEFVKSIDWQSVIDNTMTALNRLWHGTLVPIIRVVRNLATEIFEYLRPSLVELWETIQTQLLPTMIRLWKEIIQPLVPVVGTLLVIAFKAFIETLNILITVVSSLTRWLVDHKATLIALGAVIGSHLVIGKFNALAAVINTNVKGAVGKLSSFIKNPANLINPWALIATAAVLAAGLIIDKWKATTRVINNTGDAIKSFARAAEDAMKKMDEAVKKGKATKAEADRLRASIEQGTRDIAESRAAEKNPLNILKDFFRQDPRFKPFLGNAMGGTVMGGRPHIVGEQGAEVFIPPSGGGTIVPNNQMSGSTTINLSVNVGTYAGTPTERRRLAKDMFEALKDVAKQQGISLSKMIAQ